MGYGRGIAMAAVATTLVVACGSSDDSRGTADGSGGASGGGGGSSGGSGGASGGGPSLPVSSDPLAVEDLGDAFETILCEVLIQCEGAQYRDVADCKSDREPEGEQDVLDGVAEGRIAYDADAMGECRALFEQDLCAFGGAFLFIPSVPEIVEFCMVGSGGMQTQGEPCRGPIECAAGFYCDDSVACPGTCQATRALGESCARDGECAPSGPLPDIHLADLIAGGQQLVDEISRVTTECFEDVCHARSAPGDPCQPTLDCIGTETICDTDSMECLGRRTSGPCSEDRECARAHFCDMTSPAADGVCVPESGSGGPCFFASDCIDDLRCVDKDDNGRGTCGDPSASGGWCDSDSDCQTGLECGPDWICVALPAEGDPCTSDCALGLICQTDVCLPVSYPGEPCNDDTRPCVGRCLAGTCEPRATLGEPCSEDTDCASRTCIDGACIDDELCENRVY